MADTGKDIPSKTQESSQQAKETLQGTKERVTRSTEDKTKGQGGDKGSENPAAKIGEKVKDAMGIGK